MEISDKAGESMGTTEALLIIPQTFYQEMFPLESMFGGRGGAALREK